MSSEKSNLFKYFKKIKANPGLSQRKLAEDLGVSLGKLNYCIKSLKDKGFIKIQNFKKIQKNKLLIFVNPKGI